MKDALLELIEAVDMIRDRLIEHGSIDPIREEGPLFDLQVARDNAYIIWQKGG
ncbi:MAG: hypothetical protein WC476_11725 [Phycisphaerae bacterium]|jgi:hypothetical protein